MNMFRNLIALAFLSFGTALWFLKFDDWTILHFFPPAVTQTVEFCYKAQPFATILSLVISLALWMTRKIY